MHEAVAAGITNVVNKSVGKITAAAADALVGKFQMPQLDGAGIGKALTSGFDSIFVAFADGLFAEAIVIGEGKTDDILDVVDAGITRVVQDWWTGDINSLSDFVESMYNGSLDLAISKIATVVNDAKGGDELSKNVLVSEIRVVFEVLLEWFEVDRE